MRSTETGGVAVLRPLVAIVASGLTLVSVWLLMEAWTPADSWQQILVAVLWWSLSSVAAIAGVCGLRRGSRLVCALGLSVCLGALVAYVPLLHCAFQTQRLEKRMKMKMQGRPEQPTGTAAQQSADGERARQ